MPKITKRYYHATPVSKGFSLIELIIVILIASLLAALVFNNLNLGNKKEKKVAIRQLKEAVMKNIGGEAELICTDKCAECFLYTNGKGVKIKSELKDLKGYILDDSYNPQEIEFGRYRDKKVCLRFHYYANGSNSQMIVESENKFYFIPSFFDKIEGFDDMDSAVSRWARYRDKLDSPGAYY